MIHLRRAAHHELKKPAGAQPKPEAEAEEALDVQVVPSRIDGARKLFHTETSKYEQPTALLASGGFRKVYPAWHTRTSTMVVIRAEDTPNRQSTAAARRTARLELQAGGRFAPLRFLEERPSLAQQILGSHTTFVIVSPLAESELGLTLEPLHALPLPQRRATIRYAAEQILLDLHRLHRERHLLHNDIKPNNCLVAADGTVHVHDFNLSMRQGESAERRLRGTLPFLAPELSAAHAAKKPVPYSEGSDLWAMGLTLRLVAAPGLGERPGGADEPATETQWVDDAVEMLGPESRALLKASADNDASKRPSAKQFAESLGLTAKERQWGAEFFAAQHHLGDRAREALRSSTRSPIDSRVRRWAELETHWHLGSAASAVINDRT